MPTLSAVRRPSLSSLALAVAVSASLAPLQAQAATMCVFDMIGSGGDAFNMARDYAVMMQREGVNLDLRAFTNESRAVDEFKAGNCDAVMATGFRTRQFNSTAASTDTLGSSTVVRNGRIDIPASYDVMRTLIQTLSAPSPQAGKLMVEGRYEVGGILPAGAAYPIVNDKRINTIEELAGKKIAALEHDPAQSIMIRRINAIPVPSDVHNIASRLSTGMADMIAAPALAYKPLGIDKSVGDRGGIARFPLMIMTYQIVLNRSRFPDDFGQKSRSHWAGQFDRTLQLIRKSEASIPASHWIDLTPENALQYTLLLRESRIDIAQQGIYDKRGLRVLKRIRCHVNPGDDECRTKSEEEWR